MELKTKNFTIKFLKQIKIPLYLVYKVEITCNNANIFNPQLICCNAGINCIRLDKNHINNNVLLIQKKMKYNERIIGFIAFQKTNFATNQPNIVFEGYQKKIKNVEVVT
jgi:hypothetical protein